MKLRSKRTFVLAGVLAVAAVAAMGAYAYWTTSGSGNGTATVGTSSAVTLHGSVSGLLYPDGPGRVVSFSVDNPSSGNQSVSPIHLAAAEACSVAWDYTVPASPTCDGGAAFVGDLVCGSVDDGSLANANASDLYMEDVDVNPATDGDIPAGAVGESLATTGTLYMNDLSTNQDACKNAFLNLELTSV